MFQYFREKPTTTSQQALLPSFHVARSFMSTMASKQNFPIWKRHNIINIIISFSDANFRLVEPQSLWKSLKVTVFFLFTRFSFERGKNNKGGRKTTESHRTVNKGSQHNKQTVVTGGTFCSLRCSDVYRIYGFDTCFDLQTYQSLHGFLWELGLVIKEWVDFSMECISSTMSSHSCVLGGSHFRQYLIRVSFFFLTFNSQNFEEMLHKSSLQITPLNIRPQKHHSEILKYSSASKI